MAVFKRGKSYWIAFCFNSTRYRKRSPDNSHKGAIAYESLLRQRLARGLPLSEPAREKRIKFKEVCDKWLKVYVRNNNKPSESLIKKYVLNAHVIPYFGNKFITEINSLKIEEYKNQKIEKDKLSAKSINNHLCILNRCLKSAAEWGIIKEIPRIKLLKIAPQKFDFLTEEETVQLLNKADGIWHDMILVAVRTGLRIGELIALRWGDINFRDRYLTVNRNIVRGIEGSPKNNKTRTVPLSYSVFNLLEKRNRVCEYVFHDDQMSPLKYNHCLRKLHKISISANLRRISWHKLRHSFASHLASKGVSIVAIKELMGHSEIKTTMRYAHVNLPVLQNAIETLEPAFQEIATILPQTNKPNKIFANITENFGRGAGN